MNKLTLALATLMSAIAISTPFAASAEGVRFACDTPNGRISQLRLPVEASNFVVSGTIKPVLFRTDERWVPTATISLQNPDTGNSLAINMIAQNGGATNAMITVRSITDGDEKTSNVGTLAIDNVVGFVIVYRQAGQSEIIIDEQSFTANAQLTNTFNLNINCSTADVIFENINWQMSE